MNTTKTIPTTMITRNGHSGKITVVETAFGKEGVLEVYGSSKIFSGPVPRVYYDLMMVNSSKEEKKQTKETLRSQSNVLHPSIDSFLAERESQWCESHKATLRVGEKTITGLVFPVTVESGQEKVTVGVVMGGGRVFEKDEDEILEYASIEEFKQYVKDNLVFYTHDIVEAHNLREEDRAQQ